MARRGLRLLAALGLAGTLAACDMAAPGPLVNTRAPVTVGLLVPYGSGNANTEALARSLENAARLAVAEVQGAEIDLQVFPTQGSAEGAASAARAAADAGARIILGPVFAEAATAAGAAVAGRGISVLTFSNNAAVAGRNVYVMGTTFDTVAERIVGYAASQGRDRIMVIHASNEAGEIARAAVERAAGASGVGVVAQGTYDFSQQGVVEALPTLAGLARDSGATGLIFTSDASGALPLLAELLPENRVDPAQIRFMGLARWDIPAQTLALRGLQGGWFVLPDPALYGGFESRYRAAHGTAPHPIAGLAFDGVSAVGALLATGQPTALNAASLTRSAGFAGVTGIFRFRSDGTAQRGLAVAVIEDNQVKVIDPAPRSFGGAGL
ncbi:MAG: penicillin-binding protein activator [Rhodobacteraceae bacterium]|nr:penicillin-binding protein activator [Paracoccaceae bacterium]